MRYQFYTADVFTNRIFGGNQLAVFPWASGLRSEQMHEVAREFNISETVFVLPAENDAHTRRLRIFTPGGEIPFAGHPTVGTAHVLATIGEIQLHGAETRIIFEEGVGPVPVTINARAGRPRSARLSAAVMPEAGPPPPPVEALAPVLSLPVEALLGGEWEPEAYSCGVPYLFIPLRDRQALAAVRLDLARWEAVLSDYWTPDLYPFVYDAEADDSPVYARMFAPALGIPEDPATGSAAAALAGYLSRRSALEHGTLRWAVAQGVEMDRPSLLQVEADRKGGELIAIRVGGESVMVSEGQMEIPELT
ncbi:MAG: PhzF family phenazine biosynthesis protein [Candidatus Promineifilaceae bacterium]|nr:PhzF family phenazine biosynthesis protein [Candidatus Promineifilaceae bacterium]